ncbi:hypothetical protein K2O51_31445 (plasmid) [Cupriavidus pinatubonensis]|uniref:hypothetical protein n=1 Tax=Cupriavidus pinatubonensis TaxID=248026 RepID=UPI001C73461F|nr:hypothetical protein [Cupriavidus pinatubonensis]QYY33548.1 hypothetical protein K2O51_31445 [Cupriavidus pinatubonensis]
MDPQIIGLNGVSENERNAIASELEKQAQARGLTLQVVSLTALLLEELSRAFPSARDILEAAFGSQEGAEAHVELALSQCTDRAFLRAAIEFADERNLEFDDLGHFIAQARSVEQIAHWWRVAYRERQTPGYFFEAARAGFSNLRQHGGADIYLVEDADTMDVCRLIRAADGESWLGALAFGDTRMLGPTVRVPATALNSQLAIFVRQQFARSRTDHVARWAGRQHAASQVDAEQILLDAGVWFDRAYSRSAATPGSVVYFNRGDELNVGMYDPSIGSVSILDDGRTDSTPGERRVAVPLLMTDSGSQRHSASMRPAA